VRAEALVTLTRASAFLLFCYQANTNTNMSDVVARCIHG
jgi:hypothetical protein